MKKPLSINKWNYGNYSSYNYGTSIAIEICDLTLYFSYDTIVAFKEGTNFYISENIWSKTTGKHLNWLEKDKKSRLKYSEFKDKLEKTLNKYNIVVDEEKSKMETA